jgi:hypothetical protein
MVHGHGRRLLFHHSPPSFYENASYVPPARLPAKSNHVLCMSISAWREMMLTPPPEFHMRCLYVGLNVGIVSTFKFEKGRNEKVTYCRSSSSPTIEQRTNQQHAHHGTMAHGHDHGDFRPTEPIIVGARPTTDGEDLWYQIPCT